MNHAGDETTDLNQVSLRRDRFEVLSGSQEIRLTLAEFKILAALVDDAGSVKTRDQLLGHIAPDHKIVIRNIDVHIRSIRKKLGQGAGHLVTIRGEGYKWVDHQNRDSCYQE